MLQDELYQEISFLSDAYRISSPEEQKRLGALLDLSYRAMQSKHAPFKRRVLRKMRRYEPVFTFSDNE